MGGNHKEIYSLEILLVDEFVNRLLWGQTPHQVPGDYFQFEMLLLNCQLRHLGHLLFHLTLIHFHFPSPFFLSLLQADIHLLSFLFPTIRFRLIIHVYY